MNDTTNVTTELRAMVRRELPEVSEIQDPDLREKVIEVWALAIAESSFTAISEITASGNPASPPLKPRQIICVALRELPCAWQMSSVICLTY